MVRQNFITILFSILLLAGCSSGVIQIDNQGKRPRIQDRKYFSGVKKKVALLSFFNESPFLTPPIQPVCLSHFSPHLWLT